MAAEDYVGPPGHEKKFHKTHFHVTRTLKLKHTKPDEYEWVRVGVGRYVRRKVQHDEKQTSVATR